LVLDKVSEYIKCTTNEWNPDETDINDNILEKTSDLIDKKTTELIDNYIKKKITDLIYKKEYEVLYSVVIPKNYGIIQNSNNKNFPPNRKNSYYY
jgi:hypothetical protein